MLNYLDKSVAVKTKLSNQLSGSLEIQNSNWSVQKDQQHYVQRVSVTYTAKSLCFIVI